MKKLTLFAVFAFLAACGKDPQEERREKQREQLTTKLDEMKTCLKYADQESCERDVGLQIFTDQQTKQMMFKDRDSGNYVLPTQGPNGQPQYQTFQQYPPPQVINNYVPVQNHSNMDFFMGTMLGMSMMHMAGGGMGYAPPYYSRGGNTTINKTTIVKNYNRPYDSGRDDRQRQQREYRQEQRRRNEEARNLRDDRARQQEQRRQASNTRPDRPTSASSGAPSNSKYTNASGTNTQRSGFGSTGSSRSSSGSSYASSRSSGSSSSSRSSSSSYSSRSSSSSSSGRRR